MVVLLITKPFEFRAKLMGRFSSDKPTTVQFGNLYYVIPELNTKKFRINNKHPTSYIQGSKKVIY
jgi:hypothetical protein